MAATAPHVLFLDGDDELTPHAARTALAAAEDRDVDMVGFGVTVVEKDGRTGGGYEIRLQQRHTTLDGEDVLRGLFPIGRAAQGQLWRYLFRTGLLRDAYEALPEDLSLPRVNDLPLLFTAAVLARSFVSIPDKLYRYHFGRGGSGHDVDSVERAAFYTAAIDSVDSIRPSVERLARTSPDPTLVVDAYASVRLSIIGYVGWQLIDRSDAAVLPEALTHLFTVCPAVDVVTGVARFYPRALGVLKFHTPWLGRPDSPARTVLLATSAMRTGGVSAVIATQARHLTEAGYRVVIVAREGGTEPTAVPRDVEFVQLSAKTDADRLRAWGELCRSHAVDIVIDHQVLYTDLWPEYALVARAEGAATIGWIHNFIARPVYDGNGRLSYIERCAGTLASIITLSARRRRFQAPRGATRRVRSQPPVAPAARALTRTAQRTLQPDRAGVVGGRLEQRTKQVYALIEVSVQLSRRGVDHRLTVIGPDWDDVTAQRFNAAARRRRVGDRVRAIGPRRGEELRRHIDTADVFVSTSIIEAYQLTIAEAQARGLPVAMYELPWLLLVRDNPGIVSVPQGDATSLADEIARLVRDSGRYERLSRASVEAAHRAHAHDFGALYRDTVEGTLPAPFSPEPTADDASLLLGLLAFYAERGRGVTGHVADRPSSLGERLWRRGVPLGRAVLKRLPALRPLAHRAKRRLWAD